MALVVSAALMVLVTLLSAFFLATRWASGDGPEPSVLLYVVLDGCLTVAAISLVALVFRSAAVAATPFGSAQVERLRAVGVVLLIMFAVELLFDVSYGCNLEVFGSSIGFVVESPTSFSVPTLVLSATAFCAALLFRYGSLLQESQDGMV